MMLLQAQSIDKFLLDRSTHWVVIQNSDKPIQEWVDALSPYYKRHCQLRFFDSRSYKKTLSEHLLNPRHTAWIDQQLLKLLVVDRIDSDSYLVLDSKNMFIKPTKLFECPQYEGNGSNVEEEWEKEVWDSWIEFLENVLGKQRPASYWKPHTPFRLKTSVVKEILKDNPRLELLFDHVHNNIPVHKPVSEFILYRFYSNNDSKTTSNPFSFNFWGENETVTDFTECLNNADIKILGFHRHFICHQTDDCISEIQKKLIDLGFDSYLINQVFDKSYWMQYSHIAHPKLNHSHVE
jgi:hypothetical protein